MSESSDEDSDPSKGGGAGGRKTKTKIGLKLPFTLSPMKANKGQSSVKSSMSGVNVSPTMDETLAIVSSFIKELGSESECDQALKEGSKLLRGKNLRYGNMANAEQNVESDVAFVDQIDSMINGVSFAGKDVFKNFINSEVNIVGMINFVSDITDITKETTTRLQKGLVKKPEVSLEKVQFMMATMMLSSNSSSSPSSSSSSSSSNSSKAEFADLREEFQFEFEDLSGSMIILSPNELKEIGMSRVNFILNYIANDVNKKTKGNFEVQNDIKDSQVAEEELRRVMKVIRGCMGLIRIVHQQVTAAIKDSKNVILHNIVVLNNNVNTDECSNMLTLYSSLKTEISLTVNASLTRLLVSSFNVKVKSGDVEGNMTTVHKMILYLLSVKFFERISKDMLVSGMILECFTKPAAGSSASLMKDLLDMQSKSEEEEAKSIRDGVQMDDDETGTFKTGFPLANNLMRVLKKEVIFLKEKDLKLKAQDGSGVPSAPTGSKGGKVKVLTTETIAAVISSEIHHGQNDATIRGVVASGGQNKKDKMLRWDDMNMSSVSAGEKSDVFKDTASPFFMSRLHGETPMSKLRGRLANMWSIIKPVGKPLKPVPSTSTITNCNDCLTAINFNKIAVKGVSQRLSCMQNSYFCRQSKCSKCGNFGHGENIE